LLLAHASESFLRVISDGRFPWLVDPALCLAPSPAEPECRKSKVEGRKQARICPGLHVAGPKDTPTTPAKLLPSCA
jgi:hypothetical protein